MPRTIIKLMSNNSFGAAAKLRAGNTEYDYFRLATLEETGVGTVSRLPFSIKILLENLLRCEDGKRVSAADIDYVARGVSGPSAKKSASCPPASCCRISPASPASSTSPPCATPSPPWAPIPSRANPLMPADLVIDHSVQVDQFGTSDAFDLNALLEFQRNRERYMLLRWGQTAFQNFRVVPPDTGIVHQVNLEYLASGGLPRPTASAGLSRYRWSAPIRTPP